MPGAPTAPSATVTEVAARRLQQATATGRRHTTRRPLPEHSTRATARPPPGLRNDFTDVHRPPAHPPGHRGILSRTRQARRHRRCQVRRQRPATSVRYRRCTAAH
jgi:hypothetical protein